MIFFYISSLCLRTRTWNNKGEERGSKGSDSDNPPEKWLQIRGGIMLLVVTMLDKELHRQTPSRPNIDQYYQNNLYQLKKQVKWILRITGLQIYEWLKSSDYIAQNEIIM